ncbi:MAG: hypothetical protein ACOYJL_05995 [Tractidigestivibacter sp.]|jgi:hypothetical protein|uniref:hypothetical protein n=1 Tax=Tractidigestivibacter sp. TaxID=2847320 RepID=UPI003D89BED8
MPHQRERFERTDVPKENPHRTQIALAVIAAVFIGTAIIVSSLWSRAQAESHLGDSGLSSSINSASSVSDLGYQTSSDTFTNVLLLTSDTLNSTDSGGTTLVSAELLVFDATTNTGSLVSIPVETAVTYNGTEQTLGELFNASGAKACVSPVVSATNISISHVIVSTSDVWDEVASLSGMGASSLVSRASDFLASIYTDMDSTGLLDLAEKVNSAGTDNLQRIDAPTTDEVDDSGASTGRKLIDQVSLGLSVGTLVQS